MLLKFFHSALYIVQCFPRDEARTMLWCLWHEIAVAAVTVNTSAGFDFCSPPTTQFKHHLEMVEWLCCRLIILSFRLLLLRISADCSVMLMHRALPSFVFRSDGYFKEPSILRLLKISRNPQDITYLFLRTHVDPYDIRKGRNRYVMCWGSPPLPDKLKVDKRERMKGSVTPKLTGGLPFMKRDTLS